MSSSTPASATRSPAPLGGFTAPGKKVRAAAVWLPLLVLLVVTAAGRWLAPYDPDAPVVRDRLQPPSLIHPMGTDPLGRDVLSRVMAGARNTVPNVVFILVGGVGIGVAVGVVAGYTGGVIDGTLMRITDVFLAFPVLVLALAIVAVLGPSMLNATIAMIAVWWPWYARLVRGQVLSIKHEAYVEAARSLGCADGRILLRHVLPNSAAPVAVQASLDVGAALLTTATLGYLGVGAQPPSSEWGAMLAQGRTFFLEAWWLTGFPGLAIFATVLVTNAAGRRLRGRFAV